MRLQWIVLFFSMTFGLSALSGENLTIQWDDSNIKYHLSADTLAMEFKNGAANQQQQLIRIGSRNGVSLFPFENQAFQDQPHLNLKEGFAYIAVFGSQIRYFDKFGIVFEFNEFLASDGQGGLAVPEFYCNEEKNFALLRFNSKSGIVKTIMIYKGRLFSFSSGSSIRDLSRVNLNGTLLVEDGKSIVDLSTADQYSSVRAFYNGQETNLVETASQMKASIAHQMAEAALEAEGEFAQNGKKANQPASATKDAKKGEKKLSESEKESIEIAHKLGIKHPSELGITVSDGEGGAKDAWELVKGVINDLRVKYKSQTYDPEKLNPSDIEALDRIIETFHAVEVGSIAHLGPAGSGKSQTIAEFMGRLNANDAVGRLNHFMILELNIEALSSAGGKYVGGFDTVMNALRAIMDALPVVLVVDEGHRMKGVGSSGNSPSDMTQTLKPGMARGLLKLWTITTEPEFWTAFESDSAFISRHRLIQHLEPKGEVLINKLRNWVDFKYGGKVHWTDEMLKYAVTFSNRFDAVGAQPRKAVKFIDYLMARVMIQNNGEYRDPTLEDITKFVAREYGVDASFFDPSQLMPNLKKLSQELDGQLIGQPWFKDLLVRSEAMSLQDIHDTNKPIHRFLMVGPRGNGQMKAIKIYTESTKRPLEVIDLRHFKGESGPAELSKKIGTALNKNARTTFLFKNVGSASRNIQQALALMLQEGDVLVRNKENIQVLNMKNATVFVSMTTESEYLNSLKENPERDFNDRELRASIAELDLDQDLLEQLEIVPMVGLTKEEFSHLIERQVDGLLTTIEQQYKDFKITISNKAEYLQWLVEQQANSFDGRASKDYLNGPRSIKSEVALARALSPNRNTIEFTFKNGRLEFDGDQQMQCGLSLRGLRQK